MSGGEAIRHRFDAMADGVRSSVDTERGLEARLRYLTASDRGYRALDRAGIDVKPKTLIAWLAGDRTPNKANRAKLDRAYRDLRAKNVARSMKERLSRNGRGTRVTVEPLPPSAVPSNKQTRQGQFEDREITVRPSDWDRLVDEWAAGDFDGMDDAWIDIAGDLGSPPEAYYEVAHIGFAA